MTCGGSTTLYSKNNITWRGVVLLGKAFSVGILGFKKMPMPDCGIDHVAVRGLKNGEIYCLFCHSTMVHLSIYRNTKSIPPSSFRRSSLRSCSFQRSFYSIQQCCWCPSDQGFEHQQPSPCRTNSSTPLLPMN